MATLRYLSAELENLAFGEHKIALVSGPRQCGKTTLAKMALKKRGVGSYGNWDDLEFRRLWSRQPKEFLSCAPASRATPLFVLDEIHKARGWKQTVKGLFDTREDPYDLLVTGSARLNVYRRGGDSLLGRALHFRMHPFSLGELVNRGRVPTPDDFLHVLQTGFVNAPASGAREALDRLVARSGFPEPFLLDDERKARLWRQTRMEKIVREDLRDMSRISELSRIESLATMIPERVAHPLSRAALRESLLVSFDTVGRWVEALKQLYYLFELRPWTASVARSLRREGKVYLFDWSEVLEPNARLENLVAAHLLKAADFWSDTGYGNFELHTLKTKDGNEIDFLMTRDRKPFLAVDVRRSEHSPVKSWRTFLPQLGPVHAVQLVADARPGVSHAVEGGTLLVAPLTQFLAALP